MDDLPFFLSFVAISDVFTALVAERSYKAAWPPGEAMDYIQSRAGTQFAPDLTEVFLRPVRSDSRIPDIFTPGIQKGKVII
jgi:HD-GYP domain-containing protein (c-di-GMP phosphodiesterase class II)